MKSQDAKRLLEQGLALHNQIRMLEESLERAWAKVTKITQTPNLSGVRGSYQPDAIADYVAKAEAIVEEITRLQRMQIQILRIIFQLDDLDLQNVLQLRYIDGLTWKAVGERLGISQRNAMSLHKKAIELLSIESL